MKRWPKDKITLRKSGAGHRAKLGGLAAWLQCVPLKGGGIIIRSVRSGTTW